MIIYTLLLVIIVSIAILIELKPNKYIKAIPFILLIIFGGLRAYNIGFDTENYNIIYQNISIQNFPQLEIGFILINIGLKSLDLSFQWVLFIFQLLTVGLTYRTIERDEFLSKNFTLMILIYISIWNLYFLSLTGIRQALAISIFFHSIRFIKERRFLKFLFVIFIGSLFHYSILFTLPFYYILQRSYSKLFLTFITIIVLTIFLTDINIGQLVFDQINFLKYSNYQGSAAASAGQNSNILLLYLMIMMLLLYKYNTEDKNFMMYNGYFLYVLLYFITIKTEILTRYAWYLAPFCLYAFPLAKDNFKKRDRIIITSIIIVLLIVLYFRYVSNIDSKMIPYKLNI